MDMLSFAPKTQLEETNHNQENLSLFLSFAYNPTNIKKTLFKFFMILGFESKQIRIKECKNTRSSVMEWITRVVK